MFEHRAAALAAVLASLAVLAPRAALADPCALAGEPEAVAVERAIDGDTVELDDGRILRLGGIAAPKPPLSVEAKDWPLGDRSRDALAGLTAGKILELRIAASSPDRHARLVGQLSGIEAADHAEIASLMLARGLALRAADPAGRDCGATLASAEAEAIGARLGLWSEPYYAVRDAADGAALAADAGRFVVAQGRVASVRTSAGRAYVNFGERWRDALSLVLSEATLRRLGGFEVLGLKSGARLRARGVVEARLGPTIYVSEAGQIERLESSEGRTR